MLLENCVLTVNLTTAAPLTRNEPEEAWVRARDAGAIPKSLYDLYCNADYLSFGGGPSFLRDGENVLFSYFTMILRSLMETLVDAHEQIPPFIEAQGRTYDLGKKTRGEPWEATADAKARRCFRDLLIALQSGLDSFADLVALFLTGLVPGLTLGRAQFTRIEAWLERPLAPSGLVLTPYDFQLRRLYDALRPLVLTGPPERDWLPLMRMLRNKVAHLGQPVFRQVGLHDENFRFHAFVPRQWPFIWEKHMKPHDPNARVDKTVLPKLFRELLIHQDIVTYAEGLRQKVLAVVSEGVLVVSSAYKDFANFGVNQGALAELQGNTVTYDFEHFTKS
jgi:hypothetical protein